MNAMQLVFYGKEWRYINESTKTKDIPTSKLLMKENNKLKEEV